MKYAGILMIALAMLTACNSPENKALSKRSSSGKTCEVLLATDKVAYEAAAKAWAEAVLKAPQEGLPQTEARFNVVNITVDALYNTQMFKMHRNIIICTIGADKPNKCYIRRNQWAEPQVVVEVAASDGEQLKELLETYSEGILNELYQAEYERMERAFYKDRNVELMARVKEKLGFSLTLPQEFSWAKEEGDFLWLRKETKDFGLGVLVYVSKYQKEEQFSEEKILNRLDTMMRREVAGPAEGSYMGTERRVEWTCRKVAFEGVNYCVETRGLWRLFGDYMGGPYVSYTLLSPDGTRVVDLVGYVYCPRFDKRDYLMQVDGICRSAQWDKE